MRQDLRRSREYRKYMAAVGFVVENGCFIKKLPLLPWSVMKCQRPDKIDLRLIEKTAAKHKAMWLAIEPVAETKPPKGYRPGSPMLPSKTIWLDLAKSEKQLLNQMHSKTRYNIGRYKQAIEVYQGGKISQQLLGDFYAVYRSNFQRQKFWGLQFNQLNHLVDSFAGKAYLLWIPRQGGLLMLVHDQVAYYAHNGASDEGKKNFAPTSLAWQAIKLAKKIGCVRFDFEGIADERFPVTRAWAGFTRFKKGFGGEVVEYPRSFSKWRCPL